MAALLIRAAERLPGATEATKKGRLRFSFMAALPVSGMRDTAQDIARQSFAVRLPALAFRRCPSRAVSRCGLSSTAASRLFRNESSYLEGYIPLSRCENSPFERVVFHPRDVKIHPRAVTLDPRAVTLDPRAVTLDPCAVTLDPRAVTLDPRAVTLDPRAVTLDPRAVTLDPRAVTLDPRAVKLHPRAVIIQPPDVKSHPSGGEKRDLPRMAFHPCVVKGHLPRAVSYVLEMNDLAWGTVSQTQGPTGDFKRRKCRPGARVRTRRVAA
jgi:hypothetical protein